MAENELLAASRSRARPPVLPYRKPRAERKTGKGCSTMRRRVCLFGTSADPPTGDGGHLGIVRHLISLNFDEVRVLPVYRHMFGSKRGRQAPFQDRVAMCRLLVKGIPNATVSEIERRCFEEKAQGL